MDHRTTPTTARHIVMQLRRRPLTSGCGATESPRSVTDCMHQIKSASHLSLPHVGLFLVLSSFTVKGTQRFLVLLIDQAPHLVPKPASHVKAEGSVVIGLTPVQPLGS